MEITRRAILGRCISADEIKVENTNVVIRRKKSQILPFPIYTHQYYTYDRLTLVMMAICADEWKGIFQEYTLYVYIAPRDLNEADQKRMEEYNEKDPDYVQSVKES